MVGPFQSTYGVWQWEDIEASNSISGYSSSSGHGHLPIMIKIMVTAFSCLTFS